jgi:hypothetical protein
MLRPLHGLPLLVLIFLTCTCLFFCRSHAKNRDLSADRSAAVETAAKQKHDLKKRAAEAKSFVINKNFNQQVCFLIDMSISSARSRFFVYHFGRDSVINSGLVTHGRCNENWLEGRKYGNTVGCGCTSLGKYKVGHSYNGRFGLAYKLYGLEKSNDRAFARFVVLHGHECVPETVVNDEICQSDGCPTVAPGFLKYLKPIINQSQKPVLLWIYE